MSERIEIISEQNESVTITEAFPHTHLNKPVIDSLSDIDGSIAYNGVVIGGSGGTVDTEMSDSSENAVQNKVIKEYVDEEISDVETQVATKQGKIGSIELELNTDYSVYDFIDQSSGFSLIATNNKLAGKLLVGVMFKAFHMRELDEWLTPIQWSLRCSRFGEYNTWTYLSPFINPIDDEQDNWQKPIILTVNSIDGYTEFHTSNAPHHIKVFYLEQEA